MHHVCVPARHAGNPDPVVSDQRLQRKANWATVIGLPLGVLAVLIAAATLLVEMRGAAASPKSGSVAGSHSIPSETAAGIAGPPAAVITILTPQDKSTVDVSVPVHGRTSLSGRFIYLEVLAPNGEIYRQGDALAVTNDGQFDGFVTIGGSTAGRGGWFVIRAFATSKRISLDQSRPADALVSAGIRVLRQ